MSQLPFSVPAPGDPHELPMSDDLLRRLREAGLLDHEIVRRFWREHLDGTRNWQFLLWDVLMLEAWRERWT